jgi:hypothetical protein
MEIEDRPRLGLKLIPPRGRTGHGDVGISAVYALFRLKDEYAYILYPPGSPGPKRQDLGSSLRTWCRRASSHRTTRAIFTGGTKTRTDCHQTDSEATDRRVILP